MEENISRKPLWPLILASIVLGAVGLGLFASFLGGFLRGYNQSAFHTHWQRAVREYNDKNYGFVIDDASQMIALRPQAPVGYDLRGNAYRQSGRYTAAITDYTSALVLSRSPAALGRLYSDRGNAYLQRQDYALAIADYNASLALTPGAAQILQGQVCAYTGNKQYAQAIQFADALIAPHPMRASGYLLRAWVEKEQGDHTRAAADYRRAMHYAPEDTAAYDSLANMEHRDGKDDEAVQAALAEVQANPADPSSWGKLGWWQYVAGNYAASRNSSRRAIALDNHLGWAQLDLGLCYAECEDWPMAEKTFTEALPYCTNQEISNALNATHWGLLRHPHSAAIQHSQAMLMSAVMSVTSTRHQKAAPQP